MNSIFIRLIDLIIALLGVVLSSPLFMVIFTLGAFDTGSPIFIQERVGKNRKSFKLIKFRTMSINTESVATHMVHRSSVTRFGAFLRKTKLDELPQLINVLKGEMSFVGPRPCLFNQEELVLERIKYGVFNVRPGITGLAQVNNIDMSTPKVLVKWDVRMIESFEISMYLKLIIQTLFGAGFGDKIKG